MLKRPYRILTEAASAPLKRLALVSERNGLIRGRCRRQLRSSPGKRIKVPKALNVFLASFSRLNVLVIESREKVYSRQISAPILKRKTSRFGLGQFLGTVNNISGRN